MAQHAHPDTPLGGGGPGHFRVPGPRTPERSGLALAAANSGTDFAPRQFKAGEPLYAFDSADYVGKDADSPFWLDQASFDDVKAKFERDGVWDRQGVKNYLALPRFNKADGIVQGTVASDCVGVQSNVGPATEIISYIGGDGTVVPAAPSLPGGGLQLSPPVGSIQQVGATP